MPGVTIVPFAGATLGATSARVLFNGGAFVVSFSETKFEPFDPSVGPTSGALVEIAKLLLTPQALVLLRQQIDEAEALYVSAMGHPLPNPGLISDALNAAAAIESIGKKPRG